MKKLFSVIISIFALCNCAFEVDYSKYNVSDINAIRKATKAYQNEFKNKEGGIVVDITNPTLNANYFESTYTSHFWYRK